MSAPAAQGSGPHGPSLARRLLRPLAWGWLGGLCAAVVGAFLLARDAANTAFDRSLQDQTAALAAKVIWSERGPLLDVSRQVFELLTWDSADRNSFVVVDADGAPLAGDGTVPVPPDHGDRLSHPQLFDAVHLGEAVRGAVFAVSSPMLDRRVSVIVVETKRQRRQLMRDLQLAIVGPAAALGALTFGLLAWGVRSGLLPLRRLGDEITLRELHDWRPLPLDRVPLEAVPMVERINTLMGDVQHSVALQRRFLADAAHQLRTPVAGIRVLAQELEQELRALPARWTDGAAAGGAASAGGAPADLDAAAASWRPLLGELSRSTDRLARLIGQLLSLAGSETALAMEAQQRSQDIVPLLREATESLVLQALREGRHIELDAPDGPVIARAHPLWLGEVVNNLLDNARRYGGGRIVLRVRQLPAGGAEVRVEDDGRGVTPQELPRLFEPFWRGESADLRNDGGTGLGLAIAREIVERLGGRIEARTRPQVDGMHVVIHLAP